MHGEDTGIISDQERSEARQSHGVSVGNESAEKGGKLALF
jgi:hypothetical protein